MHDTPVSEIPSEHELEMERYADGLTSPPDHSPLAIEDPSALPKMIRLLKAHAKGPEEFDRVWRQVQAENKAASSTPPPSGNPK